MLTGDTYSWDELLDAVSDDIESRFDETLEELQPKTGFDTADATAGTPASTGTVMAMATEPGADAPADVPDPIAYFLDDQRYHGKSERTLEAYGRVLRQFETFLSERFGVERVAAAQRRECMAWIHSLRGEFRPSTIASYASYLNRFYDYMNRVGVFDENPMALVMEELSESIETNPTRRDISVPEIRSFVA